MKTYIVYIFTTLLLFFAPIQGLLISVGTAIALDTIFGIAKAIKLEDKITSRKLSNIVSKFVLYQAAVLLIFTIDTFLLSEFFKLWFSIPFFFTKIVTIILIFIETVSIKENFEEAFNIDIFKMLKKALKRGIDIKEDIDILKP
jgi:hypothetical protein